MTVRLEDQIREVALYADDVVEAVSVSEVLERAVPVQPLPVPPASRSVRRGLLVATAAFVVAILVAAPFLLSSSSDRPPATVPVEVTTSIAEDTPTTVADPVPTTVVPTSVAPTPPSPTTVAPPILAPTTTIALGPPATQAQPFVTDVLPVGGQRAAVVDGGLWVLDPGLVVPTTVSRVDIESRSVTTTSTVAHGDSGHIGGGDGAVVVSVSSESEGQVVLLDTGTGTASDPFSIGPEVRDVVAMTEEAVWVVTGSDDVNVQTHLAEIDRSSGAVVLYPSVSGMWWSVVIDQTIWGYDPDGLTRFDLNTQDSRNFDSPIETTESKGIYADGAIWVPGQGDIVRFDPVTHEYSDPIELGSRSGPSNLLYEGNAIWAALYADPPNLDRLVRVDVASRSVTDSIEIDGRGHPVPVAAGGLIWLLMDQGAINGSVVAFDPWTRQIIGTYPIDGIVREVVGDETAVWVVSDTTTTRIQLRP